jgi:protein SCO1/2
MMERKDYGRSEHCYKLPDLALVDAGGEQVRLHEVLDPGQPVMLNFIFTTCTTICPVQSAAFRQVQQQLGTEHDQVRMISISIDPEYDTPERLQAYAGRFEAGPQWQFLTGDLAAIVAVQRAFNAYRGNKMSHEPLTLLRASPDTPWVRLDGLVSASDIIREYRQLGAD